MDNQDKQENAYLKILSNRLRELRKAAGYNNYENFAFEKGLARAQYGRYENGSDLRFSTLMRVIEALGVTPSEFFNEDFDLEKGEDDE